MCMKWKDKIVSMQVEFEISNTEGMMGKRKIGGASDNGMDK